MQTFFQEFAKDFSGGNSRKSCEDILQKYTNLDLKEITFLISNILFR